MCAYKFNKQRGSMRNLSLVLVRTFVVSGLLLAHASAHAVTGAAPNPTIQNLPPNTWYEVPDSQMNQVQAEDCNYNGGIQPCFPGIWQGNYRSNSGLFPWSGGAFDSKRNRMIIWGGGHHDYYGNELYTFDLTTLTWERVNDPSPVTAPNACTDILADGNPNSRHTYYMLDYIPTTDKFFTTPGYALSCSSGGQDKHTWTFDFDTKSWIDMQPATETDSNGDAVQPPTWNRNASAYDPIDNKVYSVTAEGLFAYDVAANRWDKLHSKAFGVDRGAVMDYKRHKLVVIGSGDVIVYDIGSRNYSPEIWQTLGGQDNDAGSTPISLTSGGGFVDRGYRPGVNYDPVVDRIVVWDGGAVHALNMDTKEWTHLSEAPQLRFWCGDYACGTYGRFRYSPRENAYIAVNDANKNVLIYKLADSSEAPAVFVSPISQTVVEGSSASFSVTASGAAPLTYQWRRNGATIVGATGISYTIPAVSTGDNGAVYDCIISNGLGNVTSDSAVLTVSVDSEAPTIASVSAPAAIMVTVTFNEAVTQTSAEQVTNYAIDGGVSIQSATLIDNTSVQLTVSELSVDTSYTLSVSGVQDRSPAANTIAPFSSQTFSYLGGENFEDGVGNWTPLTASRWEVVQDEGDKAYHLNTSNYAAGSGDRLGEYSLLAGSYGDFELNLQAKLGDTLSGNSQADFAIVFGYQDENNYYFMMFNNEVAYSALYKVANGQRVLVAPTTSDWLNDNAYHAISINRNGNTISISFDGTEVINVADTSFGAGRLGVGSFNDSVYFDDIRVIISGTGGDTGGGDTGGGDTGGGDTGGGDTGGGDTGGGDISGSTGGGGGLGPTLVLILLLMAYVRRRVMHGV